MRLDVGENFHQVVAQLVDALGQFAGQLLIGGGQGQFGAGMNQIRHRLGLGQIDAPIEKGAPRKFTGRGQARAFFENRIQNQLGREQPAVAGDLDHILAGEGARRAHDGHEHLVHHLVVTNNFTEMNGVRRRQRRRERGFPGGFETGVRYRQRARAGKADDRYAAFAQGRGNGGDGIGKAKVQAWLPSRSCKNARAFW